MVEQPCRVAPLGRACGPHVLKRRAGDGTKRHRVCEWGDIRGRYALKRLLLEPETLYRPRLRRADIAQQFHKNSQLLPNNQLRGRSVKSRRSDPNRSSTSPRRLQRSSRRRHMNGKTSVAIRGEIASYVERCWLRHQKPKVKNTAAARPNQVMAY
jgi:hypothetical protein